MVYTVGVIGPSHFADAGRDALRRVRRSTFTEGAIMERAGYNRHSRARMAETAKDASKHAKPKRIGDAAYAGGGLV